MDAEGTTVSKVKFMAKESLEIRAVAENKRLTAALKDANISERRMDALKPVVENTAWMKAKLDDARETIKNSQIVISYDNGGGQKGIRENPLFKGYESLWKSYMIGMGKILDALPPEAADLNDIKDAAPQTVLSMVRTKHKKEA